MRNNKIMMINHENSIAVLNSLVVINNDRMEGYKTAAEDIDKDNLKHLFRKFHETSSNNHTELVAEIMKMGGTPDEGTKASGKLHRVWMDVKAAVSGKDEATILSSCEFGEDAAIEVYNTALADTPQTISQEQNAMINNQLATLEMERSSIVDMKEATNMDS
jgi:uncharacterized protein (TIGR02284 family)